MLYSSGDDDILVNLTKLYFVVEETIDHASDKSKSSITCVYGGRVNDVVHRHPSSKNAISWEKYPNRVYPRYCLGGFYTMKVETVKLLYLKSKTERHLLNDDAWITGILRKKCNISDETLVFKEKNDIAFHHGSSLVVAKWQCKPTLSQHKCMACPCWGHFSKHSWEQR